MTQTIEIFRTGRHTATAGQTLAFSEADLSAMAAAYDPALHEAPIVVGHPTTDGPAYGWVAGLTTTGDRLQAAPRQVDAAFAELVRAGRFKTVSASFYAPDSPANPKPGVYYLRHVGFLGAQPPAVKGLRPVNFAAADEGIVEFADGWTMGAVARLFRGLREWIIGSQGQEAADRVLPAWDVEQLTAQAAVEQQRDIAPAPAFAEPPNPEEQRDVSTTPTAAEQAAARVAELEAEIAPLRQQAVAFAEAQAAARRTDDAAFLERLQAEGRLLPAVAPIAAGLLARVDAVDVVSFAEGQAATTERDALRVLLAAMPRVVNFGEVAGADAIVALPDTASPAEIALASIAFQEAQKAKGIIVSNIEAVKAVTEGAAR